MNSIPVHKLTERASSVLEIKYAGEGGFRKEGKLLGAHRDDHYIFFILEEGEVSLTVDFEEIAISKKTIYYILPGQVHHGVNNGNATGWFLAVDTALIPNDFRAVFEGQLLTQKPYCLPEHQYQQCQALIRLLHEQYSSVQSGAFYRQLLHSLLHSFIGIAACGYLQPGLTSQRTLRPVQIAQSFKQLLAQYFQTIKQPAQYAAMLNISESYLNESLKKVTGFSVTYLITNEVMLEAKRLLYYSNQNVKEIAHTLGYEDHTYFSRLFKKVNRVSPLAFKANYRK